MQHSFQARHRNRKPLLGTAHPHATLGHSHHHRLRQRHARGHSGRHHRASVVSPGNPATVQLHGSDTSVTLPLAQHINVAGLTTGSTVIAALFDASDPSDGLIVAVY